MSGSTSTRPNDFFDLPDEARADDQYVVEKIIAKRRTRKGKCEYLLKWAGFSDADNTWEAQHDIHPDLIAEFERQQVDADTSNPIYSILGEDPPKKQRVSLSATSSSSNHADSPPAKKKKKTSNSVIVTPKDAKSSPPSPSPPLSTTPTTTPVAATNEVRKKVFGVEKGWRVRAVIGAAKQKDSSVLYAVDYVQGSPILREYVPSEIAHIYIPRELIEFFQKKIVWNTPK
ncbi:unnamed protein product [Adineta ricciae]|uniref:Chromo domain-containing protein n=1 Tax=Adineta ricciae TaxID=249248 RepID=A0A814L813_ADIRI|nr:unnamed protein product [Adineta ricciae]CAF1550488.1 unnamed protein product [Adineta ricciae]